MVSGTKKRSKSSIAAKRWIGKSEIDYHTYFLTSWITFNAWFGKRYTHNTERDKIEKIKVDANDDFHKSINVLLEETVHESELFLQHLSNLYQWLEHCRIEYKTSKFLLIDELVEINNPFPTINDSKHNIRYHFRPQGQDIKADITDSKGNILCDYKVLISLYKVADFDAYLNTRKISATQKKFAKQFFIAIAPKIKLEIIVKDKEPNHSDFYDAPDFKFKRDSYKINDEGHYVIKVLVEALYQLRNQLVHGELIPTKNTNQIYQHAYLIMQMLLPKLI